MRQKRQNLYADRITNSMQRAIGETERRCARQLAHNTAQGITPIGITKRIKDIIDGIYNRDSAREGLKAAQNQARYDLMGDKEMTCEIKRVEKEMLESARNLEFERAAKLRDELHVLKQRMFINAA